MKLATKIYYLFIILTLVISALSNPKYNWDVVPYSILVKNLIVKDLDASHAQTYQELKGRMSEQEYDVLANGSSYRMKVNQDTDFAKQVLPFYQSRVLYIGLSALLVCFGISSVSATYLISIIAAAISLFFLYKLLEGNSYLTLFVLPLLLVKEKLYDSMRFSTPDLLVFMFGVILIYLLKNKNLNALIIFPLLILSRQDSIIIVFLFAGYLFVFHPFYRNFRKHIVFASVFSVATYLIISHTTGVYPWSSSFYFTFIERIPSVPLGELKVSFSDYGTVLFNQLMLYKVKITVFYVLSFIIIYFTLKFGCDTLYLMLSVLSVIYITVRLLLFPLIENRFFILQYLLLTLAVLSTIENIFPNMRKKL